MKQIYRRTHTCRSVISIKLQSNFIEITLRHGYSPVNLLYIFRTLFSMNTSGQLTLCDRYALSYPPLLYFFVAPELHKLWSQTFWIAQWKTSGEVRWDIPIKIAFQACIWLILSHFRLKLNIKKQTFEGFSPRPYLWHLEHDPEPPSSFPTHPPHYRLGAPHMTSTKTVYPKTF